MTDAVATAAGKPAEGASELTTPEGAVGDSLSVAVWTVISRVTGILRGIAVAAVLGVTFFANTYQFTNSLPNTIFYGLLGGALFSSLLVPALVPHIDSGDRRAVARTAGGLLGVAMIGMLLIIPAAAVVTPGLLHVGSAGAASAAANSQAHIGAVLALLLLPQIPLYAIVATATAVMNAHRRFALPAAAPALENLGTIAVLGVVAVLYSREAASNDVSLSLLLLLGAGTTGAVMLHAGVQWWGARRVGVTLIPNVGWRDPQVRATIRRALPAVGQAALASLQLGLLRFFADGVAGGVVAFQLAASFCFLVIALGASPVGLSLVPRLSRMTGPGQSELFRDTYMRGLVFAAFLVVPAATAYAVLARPLAGAVAFGSFSASGGRALIAAALLGLAPAIIGETTFLVTSYACYARKDTTHPLRGMIIQAMVCAGGVVAVAHLRGPLLLTGLGLSFSAGGIVGSLYLVYYLRRGLPRGGEPALRPLLRILACSVIMAIPTWAAANFVASRLTFAPGRAVAMLTVCLTGAVVYFAAQTAMHAPQVQWLGEALRMRWRRLAGHRPGLRWSPFRLTVAMPRLSPVLRRRQLDAVLLLGIFAVGALATIKVKYAVAAAIAIVIIGLVMAKPVIAAYLLIFITPLIVGMNAGKLVPLLRPNEALIVLFGVAIALRWLARVGMGPISWPRLDWVDASLIALGITSSAVPLLMMMVRQRPITSDDLLYCIVVWKLLAEYVIVRTTVTTREQTLRCLVLSLIAGAIVSAVGIVQSLGAPGVNAFLAKYYAIPGEELGTGRASSLLGLPAATGDLAILSLAIAVAMMVRGYPHRRWLGGLAVLYALGVVAAAEFSAMIGLVVALVAIMAVTRSGRMALYAVPVALSGGLLLWPVIQIRLAGFHSASGLPVSWTGRLYNLQTYFWPTLFSDHNWIWGVRPSARVSVIGKISGFVWIESGYSWLLWGGGIPLLASYIAFAVAVIRKGWAYTRRADPAGIAASAVVVAMCSQLVTMLFDPHLTYRGSGDAFFLLLALVRVLPATRSAGGHSRLSAAAIPARRREGVLA